MSFFKKVLRYFPGFRSWKKWKMAIAGITYFFLCLFLIALEGAFQDSIWALANLVALVAFFGSIIALIKGRLILFHIPNRKIAGIVFIVSIFAVSLLPIPSTDEQAKNDLPEDKEQVHIKEQKDKGKEKKDNTKVKEKADNESKNKQRAAVKEKKQEHEQQLEETQPESHKNTNQSHGVPAKVTRVVDGDTIEVYVDGKSEKVRMLLVDTPETMHPTKPVQSFGPEASVFAKKTLSGKHVELEYDGPKRDKYGRLLAYVWVDGKMFNEMLLDKGLARLAYVYDPPYTHYREYMKAQNRAKNAGKGIWRKEGYVQESGFYYNKNVAQENQSTNNSSGLKYNPNGPDRDCSDFDTHKQAQKFFEAAGGPRKDPHRLDGSDDDGKVCEALA